MQTDSFCERARGGRQKEGRKRCSAVQCRHIRSVRGQEEEDRTNEEEERFLGRRKNRFLGLIGVVFFIKFNVLFLN